MTGPVQESGFEVRSFDIPVPNTGGGSIRIAEAGDGPPLVLLHGAGLGASGLVHYHANIPAFVAAGFRVIVPDLLGFGASSKPIDAQGYPLVRFTDTLAAALDAHGVGQAAFFGNSLGGAVAIDMALRYPDKVSRAVLLAPGAMESRETYFAQPTVKAMAGVSADNVDAASMRTMLESFVTDPVTVTEHVVTARVAAAKAQPREVMSSLILPDLTPRLSELDLPLLVIWGASDGICPVSGALKFAQSGANTTIIIYPQVGHWPMTERAIEVNRATLDFLLRP